MMAMTLRRKKLFSRGRKKNSRSRREVSPGGTGKFSFLRQQRLPEAYAQIHRAVMVDSSCFPWP